MLNSVTCVNIDFGTISDVMVQTVCAAKGLRTTNSFSCTASDMDRLGGLFLTASLAPLTLTLERFVPVTYVICYCMVILDSTGITLLKRYSFVKLCLIFFVSFIVVNKA